jgi:hypothetical protein
MNLRDSIFAKGEYWNGGYILGSKVEYELSDKSRIEFKSEPVISEGKITIEDNVISLLGSTIEVDGLRAIVVTVSASTDNSVTLLYLMVDNAEADVASVILTSVKFDMLLMSKRMNRYSLCRRQSYQMLQADWIFELILTLYP